MRIVMNSYILFKLNLQKDKTVNKQVLEPKHYQGEKWKIVVFALTVKKTEIGHKHTQMSYTVLAWASINVNKYITFCYLETFLLS